MILRGDQRGHPLAIADNQKREFVPLEKLFKHHTRSGVANHPAAEHFIGYG